MAASSFSPSLAFWTSNFWTPLFGTMGQTVSSPLEHCLTSVCAGRANCLGLPSGLLYQTEWVQPYNLAVNVTPAAVVRPSTAQDVAAIVSCAAANNVKVQAKSGGHSYASVVVPAEP